MIDSEVTRGTGTSTPPTTRSPSGRRSSTESNQQLTHDRFQLSPLGKLLTRNILWVLEGVRLVPQGTYKVQEMLQQGGWGCDQGGHTGTFTPMWLMVARKPLKWNRSLEE